jgi:hypothetical protein
MFEQMGHGVGQAAAEQPIHRVVGHAAGHNHFSHRRLVDEASAIFVMAYQTPSFHFPLDRGCTTSPRRITKDESVKVHVSLWVQCATSLSRFSKTRSAAGS